MDRGIIETTITACKSIIDYIQIKCLSVLGVVGFSFFFGDIEKPILASVIVLTLLDMVTGVMASVKTNDTIESKRLFKTAVKIFIYLLLISAGHLTTTAIGFNIMAVEAITITIAITELISILENASRMGYAIPKKLLNQLEDFKSKK